MGRAPNLHSSVYFGSDGWWHGRVWVGYRDNGLPDRRHVRSRTEAEVRKKVRRLERDRDRGTISKAGRAPTVREWMTVYLDDIAARELAPKTYYDYWSKTRTWILPHLGGVRLDRLQPEQLDRLYTRMIDAGKAPSHALKVHRILSRALEVALRRGKVSRNVARLVDAPSARPPAMKAFTEDEARRILRASLGRRNAARWSVGLALGLRQGEVLGLRWSYLDLERRTVKVFWQLQRTAWRHGCDDPHVCGARLHKTRPCPPDCTEHAKAKRGCPPPCPKGCVRHASSCPQRRNGGLVFREPKGKSRRMVPLPPELVPVLQAHRAWQEREQVTAANLWEDHDLVFAQANGRPIDHRDDWEEWKTLLKIAGVGDARVHDGRHTAGTLLLEQGVDIRVVQEILGHSDLRVTQGYTHVGSVLAQDAAARIGRALFGGGE
ncbi:site-specific integrase [Actinopolymorpha pittospori]|uniref:Integrase n=1 Tax=Actinopolymorpha pittospori TaxID=648752 RepID=A0A927MT36_9ACTN|nr:site-specific integrase [Actinopolymorpha pittospori]MBE1606411.1 integrase [Actinopolymorpha pittospori]